MIKRFCAYGFLKNQRYFEPFWMLILLAKGLTFLEIGLLVACREVATNLLEVASGVVADVWGRRRSMIIALLSYQVSFVLLYLADDVLLLAAGMVMFGVGDSFRSGTHKAMILTWLRQQGRESERTAVYGVTRSWSKLGSAVSVVIGTAWVLWTGDVEALFVLGVAPYGLGLLNIMSYPAALDGEQATGSTSMRAMGAHLLETLRSIRGSRPLQGLLAESAGFMGTFESVKDYLQPVLSAAAGVGLLALWGPASWSEDERGAVLVGVVYVVLFLWSAFMSKRVTVLLDRAGSEDQAARWLWWAFAAIFALLLAGSLGELSGLIILGFVMLHALEALWRPVILGRFDAHSEEVQGATLLSIESQVRSLATLVLAPALGWLVDLATGHGSGSPWWPLSVWGLLVGVGFAVWASRARRSAAAPSP